MSLMENINFMPQIRIIHTHLVTLMNTQCYSFPPSLLHTPSEPLPRHRNQRHENQCFIPPPSTTNVSYKEITTTQEEVRQLFNQLVTHNSASLHLYTDGSKTSKCVGASVCSSQCSLMSAFLPMYRYSFLNFLQLTKL